MLALAPFAAADRENEMPSHNDPEWVVQDLFQAFRRRDLEGLLATLRTSPLRVAD